MSAVSFFFAIFTLASVVVVIEARPKEADWSSETGHAVDVIYTDDFEDHGCTIERRKENLLNTCRILFAYAPAGAACFHTGMDPTMWGNRLDDVPLDSGCGKQHHAEIKGMIHNVCCGTHDCRFRCIQNKVPAYKKVIDEFPRNFHLILNATLSAGFIRKETFDALESLATTSDLKHARSKELSELKWLMYIHLDVIHDMLYKKAERKFFFW